MAVHPTILDCTIRDGSYAIDFKFTAADTALVAGLLDRAGVRYIEVGHGLGLGASEAGQGQAASRDLEVIERTRDSVSRGRIGAFFIPGIGTEADLREAAAAGLDFVRVGQNADEIKGALPVLELARELGLEAFLNFMKTYGISPQQFAGHALQAAELGAAGVYVVDSAGGMLPREVSEYVRATVDTADVPVGFHGHSNLHLAVANSIAAWEAGARFVDTSVYGIGRSSGNVPTEVMAAVFDRLGVDCGVDAMEIVDIAESYLLPLAEHLHPHTMTAVALGYGRFHSSYLPRALRAAEQAGINPYRLIVELGRQDMMRLPDELLSRTVAELSGTRPPSRRPDLAAFSDERFGRRRIGNRPTAVAELLDGLGVVAAKRQLEIVLDVVVSHVLDEEEVTAEFLLEDEFAAIGRVRGGTAEVLAKALAPHAQRTGLVLLDAGNAGPDELSALWPVLADTRVIPYRTSDLIARLLGDAALGLVTRLAPPRAVLVDPEWLEPHDVDALAARLAQVVRLDRTAAELPAEPAPLCLVAGPVAAARAPEPPALWPHVVGLGPGPAPAWSPDALLLDPADAYRDLLPAWLKATRASSGIRPVALVSP